MGQPPGWINMTDYRGSAVPMEVLQEMRMQEGIDEAEWKGRGMLVGSSSWAVLTAWFRE